MFFTNQDTQQLLTEFKFAMREAHEINLIYPFISKSMLNKLTEEFDYCLSKNILINIITTTFDHQAKFNDLYELKKLQLNYPNIHIKVEDNLERHSQRIHIKAAIFKNYQETSVIIGSSNLTYKGIMTGREWNIKLTSETNFELVQQMSTEFERLWEEPLVDFKDDIEREKLLKQLQLNQINQYKNSSVDEFVQPRRFLFKFQKEIMQSLAYRRFQNKHKHLITMATGTGKTTVAAFDYKKLTEQNLKPVKLLFLAHQKEIIDQAINTYRQVLENRQFGDVLYDGKILSEKPTHLFATIQSLANKLTEFQPNDFDVIVFDEAHHLAANSFDKVYNYFKPQEILGLTATPEREDNQDIKKYFDNEIAYELRLWDAIQQKLLSPFDYFCIDDSQTNLLGTNLTSDREVFKKINTTSRNKLLFSTIEKYLGIYARPTCLIFCATVEHAKIVANYLQTKHLKATYLTSENTSDRKRILHEFQTGRINYLCVVNIFNEGIDIPEIDTIILLRPTNSKTVYLQQLGRGLRKTELKSRLEVYDLISNIDQKYDLTIGLRNLFAPNVQKLEHEKLELQLPYDSTIILEKNTHKLILKSLQRWYKSKTLLKLQVIEYYGLYKKDTLTKILEDNHLTLHEFYNSLDELMFNVAYSNSKFNSANNQTNRNKNIIKQFIFLNNYHIINYFYNRLTEKLKQKDINLDYDNLLVTCFLYEITSMERFLKIYPNYLDIPDLVDHFIGTHKMIVKELIMILRYKLEHENLIFSSTKDLLLIDCVYTVKQILAVVQRTNFLWYRDNLKILTFQAGFLTFDNSKQIILADEGGQEYGKMTKYDQANNKFYWSLPEKMTIKNKIIKDFNNLEITKYLFIHDQQNYELKHLFTKLYKHVGVGTFSQMLVDKYLTVEFDV
ncbi:DEAD/DEAH box helicase [Spiroplasma sp. TIUS-1]|uniref:DEAD/DEAH box helicase family protein n=1 Tax=Spiroplasma sp. TIUS-1 TaxID=216963 RepID=UPI0013995C7C|nr:DEAD/DEAH box helicase family protein [Spiroplasma sp. TIUS-1]QHX35742.1 DEAD/DEAH box helicase [Spiroplasma sp. TIUS-1]